jgi:hypothetical protein
MTDIIMGALSMTTIMTMTAASFLACWSPDFDGGIPI